MGGERLQFLDGLRGWAALAVVNYHVFSQGFPAGPFAREQLRNWLPFNGNVAVPLFFLLSGFALTIGYMQLGSRRSLLRLAAGRYFRIGLPVIVACAIVLAAQTAGLIVSPDSRPPEFQRYLLFGPDLSHFLRFSFLDVYAHYRPEASYILPLWTMQHEMGGSFAVLGAVFVSPTSWVRPVLLLAASVIFLPLNIYLSLFMIGGVFADLWGRKSSAALSGWIGHLLLLIGAALPLLSPPSVPIGVVAGICLFGGVLLSEISQRLLSTRLSRWLGAISFSLYLVHGPVMWLALWALPWVSGDVRLTTAFGLSVVACSIAAAVAFSPVNWIAIEVSRTVGGWIVPREKAAFQKSDELI